MKLSRKINIDIVRFIATLMVVAIHCYPFTFISEEVDYVVTRVIFRVAVPIFLMITGYYMVPKALESTDKLKEYLGKIFKLYIISIIIYLPLNIYNGYFQNFNILEILKDIFFNGTFYHLWYFPSLLLGVLIIYCLLKKMNIKIVGIIVFILYMIGICGDSYYGIIRGSEGLKRGYDFLFLVFDYTRNGLFYVPIFLFMGYCFKKKKINIKFRESFILMIVNVILLVGEGLILYKNGIPRHNSMYLTLIPLVGLIFNIIINYLDGTNKKMRKVASGVYILHPLLIAGIHFIEKRLNFLVLSNSLVNYILVLITTIGFVLVIEKVKEVVKDGKGISTK